VEQTWRWFGPRDPVTLTDARQAGATGIVTALHHRLPGEVWPKEEIEKRKAEIQAGGMNWSVVESVEVSDPIKRRAGSFQQHIDAYRETIRNLASCGIHTICYNFMPVLDWTRTDLAWELPDGALALRFDATSFAAFDLYILKRPGADDEWSEERKKLAHNAYRSMNETQRDTLSRVVLAGLPGTGMVYSLDHVRQAIAGYADIGSDSLRSNLGEFLRAVCPQAEEVGVRLCIHPDDPPRPLLGLPRIVSTATDFEFLLDQATQVANGITFCTGSLGVRSDNDLLAMARRFAKRIYFAHLRSTKREQDVESFHEAPHLDGDVDIVGIMRELMLEERHRRETGDLVEIPFRADHGHKMLTDLESQSAPGYPAVGRLRGLAELRGVMRAVGAFVQDCPTEG
jgi:mannonate dehydratase